MSFVRASFVPSRKVSTNFHAVVVWVCDYGIAALDLFNAISAKCYYNDNNNEHHMGDINKKEKVPHTHANMRMHVRAAADSSSIESNKLLSSLRFFFLLSVVCDSAMVSLSLLNIYIHMNIVYACIAWNRLR